MKNRKKVLITTTTPYMIRQFLLNDIKILQNLEYEIDVATNFQTFNVISEEELQNLKEYLENEYIQIHQIDFERNMFKIGSHIKSYKQMKKLMNEREYDLIHTHTPISSLITRIAFKNRCIFNKCSMIYTAHGFHFFKGNNPLKNFLFKNMERLGAKYTDTLITINKEDYAAAKKFKLRKNGTVEYVPGVGIDIDKINSIQGNKEEFCKELNIPNDSILLLSVGELNDNKNHKVVIECLPELPKNMHYLICGVGPLKEQHEELARKLEVSDRLHLLGYRNDVIKIMKSSDIFIFPSKREGLSVALMEAMACGLPCIASEIRGNVDLIKNNKRNYLFNLNKCNEIKADITKIIQKKSLGTINDCNKMKFYDKNQIQILMKNIYCIERQNHNENITSFNYK